MQKFLILLAIAIIVIFLLSQEARQDWIEQPETKTEQTTEQKIKELNQKIIKAEVEEIMKGEEVKDRIKIIEETKSVVEKLKLERESIKKLRLKYVDDIEMLKKI